MTTFTASEVRELVGTEDIIARARVDKMLRAYADRLEADEKAEPAAYAEFTDGGCIRMWSRQYEERLPGTRMIPLYTHPASADAERLAEALRDLVRVCEDHDRTLSRILGQPAGWKDLYLTAAREALAAHPVQAQPAAASVTDEMVERARSAFVQADDGSTGITDAIRAALLAAQEKPNG